MYEIKTFAPAISRDDYYRHLEKVADDELNVALLDAIRLDTETFVRRRIANRPNGLAEARQYLACARHDIANATPERLSGLQTLETRLVAALVLVEVWQDEGKLSTSPPTAPVRPIEIRIDQKIDLPQRSTETSVIRDEFGNITKATTRDVPA